MTVRPLQARDPTCCACGRRRATGSSSRARSRRRGTPGAPSACPPASRSRAWRRAMSPAARVASAAAPGAGDIAGEGVRRGARVSVPAALPPRAHLHGAGRVPPARARPRAGRGHAGADDVARPLAAGAVARRRVDCAPLRRRSELHASIGASATGAGVASVLIDQAGVVSRVDPDDVRASWRASTARATCACRWRPARRRPRCGWSTPPATRRRRPRSTSRALPAHAGATVVFDPAPAAFETRATQLPAGRPVTVSGVTDPSFAGLVLDARRSSARRRR